MSDDEHLPPRPRTRGDCADGERPCPYVSCRHHLYLDVPRKTSGFKVNYTHLEPWELPETCSLDVADRGGGTLEDVAAVMNVTRERVRQIEALALRRLLPVANRALSDELPAPRRAPPVAAPVRRLPVLSPARPRQSPLPVAAPRVEPVAPPVAREATPAPVAEPPPPAPPVEAPPRPAPPAAIAPPARPAVRRHDFNARPTIPPAAPEPAHRGPTAAEVEAARIASMRPGKPPSRRRAADDEWPLWERA